MDARAKIAEARSFIAAWKAAIPPGSNYQRVIEALDRALEQKIMEIVAEARKRALSMTALCAGEISSLVSRIADPPSNLADRHIAGPRVSELGPAGQVQPVNLSENQMPQRPVVGPLSGDLPGRDGGRPAQGSGDEQQVQQSGEMAGEMNDCIRTGGRPSAQQDPPPAQLPYQEELVSRDAGYVPQPGQSSFPSIAGAPIAGVPSPRLPTSGAPTPVSPMSGLSTPASPSMPSTNLPTTATPSTPLTPSQPAGPAAELSRGLTQGLNSGAAASNWPRPSRSSTLRPRRHLPSPTPPQHLHRPPPPRLLPRQPLPSRPPNRSHTKFPNRRPSSPRRRYLRPP